MEALKNAAKPPRLVGEARRGAAHCLVVANRRLEDPKDGQVVRCVADLFDSKEAVKRQEVAGVLEKNGVALPPQARYASVMALFAEPEGRAWKMKRSEAAPVPT